MVTACGGSSNPGGGGGRADVNEHLVYVNPESVTGALMPHQTVVIKRAAAPKNNDDPYQELPYEIINSGYYKFCVPDKDSHIDRIEIMDADGSEITEWRKGAACGSVRLTPGQYTIHVHHTADDRDLFLFIKPHAVSEVKTVSRKPRKGLRGTDAYTSNIPSAQFVNQENFDLNAVIEYNEDNGIDEKWGLSGKALGGYVHLKYPGFDPDYAFKENEDKLGPALEKTNRINTSNLLSFKNDGGIKIQDGSGRYLLYFIYQTCSYCTETNYLAMSVESYYAEAFTLAANGSVFTLNDSNNASLKFDNNNYNAFYTGDNDWGRTEETFNAAVRTGTVSGNTLPALTPGDVALFDGCYGQQGFMEGTTYWIINSAMTDFNDFAFNNPTGSIYTVMADRTVRVKLYDMPGYQGNLQYVSPPADGEMIMTCTDSDMLQNGSVNSISLEANTGDITETEYEHHIIVATNVCTDCDLRGFSTQKQSLQSIDFSESDLTSSDFNGITLSGINMTNAVADYSNFNNCILKNCTLTKTSFKNATFAGAEFTIDANLLTSDHSELAFQNACPDFEGADLTEVNYMDDVFPVNSEIYNGDTWWNDPAHCLISLKSATLTQSIFKDNKLWQFISAPGMNFSGFDLDGMVLSTDMAGASFSGASLQNAVILNISIKGMDFSGADLTGARINGIRFTDPLPFNDDTTLKQVNFSGSILENCDFSNLNLTGTIWYAENYQPWDRTSSVTLDVASLSNSLLFNTKLNNADLSGAFLNYVTWYGDDATGIKAVMEGTKLKHAILPTLKLDGADLKKAEFDNAVLTAASLNGLVSMEGASFYKTDLRGATFGNSTSLYHAKLAGATISVNTEQKTQYFKVMSKPPSSYKYEEVTYGATVLPANSKDIDSCPSGSVSDANDCGPVTDSDGNLTGYWIPMVALDPQESGNDDSQE